MSAVKKGHFVTPKRQSWVSQFHLVIFAFLLMGNASSSVCVAAPITMWENDPQKLSELIESGAFSVASKPVEKKPTPLPQAVVFPQPQTVGLSGQSMTGSSVSTTVIVGASPADLANACVNVPQSVSCRLTEGQDWMFIPPRFLDGIFRPPRMLVSLNDVGVV